MPTPPRPVSSSLLVRALLIGGLLGSSLATVACGGSPRQAPPPPEPGARSALVPPVAAVRPHEVVSPHGTRVDPYFWLRDDTRSNPEMLRYLAAENAYKDAALAPTRALQQALYDEMVGRLERADSSVPVFDNGYWYYERFTREAEYPIHARRKATMDAPEQILLDLDALARGHDFYRLGAYAVSPDNRLMAYTADTVGRNQYTLRVLDLTTGLTTGHTTGLTTGAPLPDAIANVEPSIAWANDSRTVFYITKDPVTLLGNTVRRHVFGASPGGDPAADPIVYQEHDTSFYLDLARTKSGRYIDISATSTVSAESRLIDADRPDSAPRVFFPRQRDHEYWIEHVGQRFVIMTNWDAKNFRIMTASERDHADRTRWRELIPHRDDVFIHEFGLYDDFIAVSERADGLRGLRVYSWNRPLNASRNGPGNAPVLGEPREIEASEPAYAMFLLDAPEHDTERVRYYYSSMTTPGSTYELNMTTGETALLKRDPVLDGFDSADYETARVLAPARDGAKIPVSLAYRKDTPRDGTAPIYQYAYGAYGDTLDPTFYDAWVSLLDRGFVIAIAHVRGGQTLGRRWYEDGRQLAKKNTFNDFIDVTEYLVAEGWGAADQVFAVGESAGGLLMGAIANMAPERYRGIIAWVPFVDAVTTMLDTSVPLTSNEFDEWGNPAEKRYYDYILSYSPYDNVARQAYPSMLVTTGLWDSQVQYFEPVKWVAKLRASKTDGNPLLLHINMDAGHGGKSGRFRQYRETARDYAFLLHVLATPDARGTAPWAK